MTEEGKMLNTVLVLRLSEAIQADSMLDDAERRVAHGLTRLGRGRYEATAGDWRRFLDHAIVMAADASSAHSRKAFAALAAKLVRALEGADMHCGESCPTCDDQFGERR